MENKFHQRPPHPRLNPPSSHSVELGTVIFGEITESKIAINDELIQTEPYTIDKVVCRTGNRLERSNKDVSYD